MDTNYLKTRYRTVSVYALLLILAGILGIICAFRIRDAVRVLGYVIDVLLPVIVGFVIAYLLMPAVHFFEDRVFSKMHGKHPRSRVRALSVIMAFSIMFIAIALIALLLIPQLLSNYTELAAHGEEYIKFAQDFADGIIGESGFFGDNETLSELLGADLDVYLGGLLVDSFLFADKLVGSIISLAGGFINFAVTAVFSLICAFGLMLYSEKLCSSAMRVAAAVLNKKQLNMLCRALRSLDRAFGGFFSGRIFESLIIGLISLVVFYITRMPYPPLLAVILAVFNLIPYFGSIFAGVVGGVIVFVAQPSMLVWFLIIDLVMEQIDGNILAPRVLGDTVGMHPLCIFVSITVMGNLLGVAGLIVGVPIAAVLIEAVRHLCDTREKKNREEKIRDTGSEGTDR